MHTDDTHRQTTQASARIPVKNVSASPQVALICTAQNITQTKTPRLEPQLDSHDVSNGSLYAAHEKIYPREIKGKYQRLRLLTVISVLTAFYGLAWFDWSDRQAILFDLPARQFSLFSITFWPQDFYILTLCLIIAALTLFAATALAGRLWCGYACPQTVWTELFLWIERITEGNYKQRKKLDAQPWAFRTKADRQKSISKALRKSTKQVLWVSLALWTGFTFVGYFTPIKTLALQAQTLNFGSWEWFWILFYGLATYGNAGFLREQVCQYMCPYARFQSAMLDPNSLVISYDATRGEPRKHRIRQADQPNDSTGSPPLFGDCVDCKICVQVCPTNIDIRDGLQYECIGCAACIDACNGVMQKLNKAPGLIRYTSEYALAQLLPTQTTALDSKQERKLLLGKIFRPRMLIYGTLWFGLVAALITTLALREPTAVDIIRDRKAFYYLVAPGHVDNVYTLKIMNKTQVPHQYTITVADHPTAELIHQFDSITVTAGEVFDLPVRLRLPLNEEYRGAQPITFILQETTTKHVTYSDTLFWYPR